MRVCEKYKAISCTGVDLINASGESRLNINQVHHLKSLVKHVRKVSPDRIDGNDTDLFMNYFESFSNCIYAVLYNVM